MKRYTTPTAWPADPEHDYALWLEKTVKSGLHQAYVTAHPKDNRGGVRSRFAVRLDLPGKYPTKAQAEGAAFYIADRFFRRKFAPMECEISTTVNTYVVTARARFRIDCHEWKPSALAESRLQSEVIMEFCACRLTGFARSSPSSQPLQLIAATRSRVFFAATQKDFQPKPE